jgi:hypothetical protein
MLPTQAGSKGQASFAPVRFVDHPSFHETDAAVRYGPVPDIPKSASPAAGHLSDDATRDLAKRMHYAAFRFSGARTNAEARTWRTRYFQPRDQIILGNRKLIYRAVQMRVRDPQIIEDCASECHLVMIRAVSSYNPWLGIRFSTYAFTCVLRELTRIVQKQFKDRMTFQMPKTRTWSLMARRPSWSSFLPRTTRS